MIRFFLLSLLCSLLASCAGPKPLKELALSNEAIQFAKKSGAQSLASGLFHKAELNFDRAKQAYDDNNNIVAKELFIKARIYAERAENSSRVKKFKSGDGPSD